MEYSKYKLVKQIFDKLKHKGFYPKCVIKLNNGHLIQGFLINVNSNHFIVLKDSGKTVKIVYTKVKEIDLMGEMVKKVYEQIIKNDKLS